MLAWTELYSGQSVGSATVGNEAKLATELFVLIQTPWISNRESYGGGFSEFPLRQLEFGLAL